MCNCVALVLFLPMHVADAHLGTQLHGIKILKKVLLLGIIFISACIYLQAKYVLYFPDTYYTVDSTEEGNCSTGEVRLNGSSPLEGRVEICINNAWGTICGNQLSSSDPVIICQSLGYPFTDAYPIPLPDTPYGSGPIFLDNLDCDGSEEGVLNCLYSVGVHSCSHDQDVAVKCVGKLVKSITT